MGDVHAGHAPEGLLDHTDSWGTLGTHVVAAKGARGARVARSLSVRSLIYLDRNAFERDRVTRYE